MENVNAMEELGLPKEGVDSHAHLDLGDFDGEIPQVIARAREAGLLYIGNVFLSPGAYLKNHLQLDAYPEIFYVVGLHPHESKDFSSKTLEEIEEIFKGDQRVKAIGEIGLDFFRKFSPEKVQVRAFEEQLVLAKEIGVPVVIHCRDAFPEALEVLDRVGYKDYPLMWHCFTMGTDGAREVLSRGWMVSIPGVVTFKNARPLKEAVGEIPLSSMVLETDCPFLTPSPFRGKRNEPAYTVYTAMAISEIKGVDVSEVWKETGKNARTFFSLE